LNLDSKPKLYGIPDPSLYKLETARRLAVLTDAWTTRDLEGDLGGVSEGLRLQR
jgi:hypothetical protein